MQPNRRRAMLAAAVVAVAMQHVDDSVDTPSCKRTKCDPIFERYLTFACDLKLAMLTSSLRNYGST